MIFVATHFLSPLAIRKWVPPGAQHDPSATQMLYGEYERLRGSSHHLFNAAKEENTLGLRHILAGGYIGYGDYG